MNEFWLEVKENFMANNLPDIVFATVILIAGLLTALWVRSSLRRMLKKSSLCRKLAICLPEESAEKTSLPEKFIVSFFTGIVLLITFVACFSMLNLSDAALPVQSFLAELLNYLPNVIAALMLIFFAWFVAAALKYGTQLLLLKVRLDEKIEEKCETGGAPCELSSSIATGVYLLIWLLFLPSILRALKIHDITDALTLMFEKVLTYLPNLFAAAVIAAGGLFAASILRKLVAGLLTNLPKCQALAKPVSLTVYALTALPVIVAALDALKLEVLSGSTGELLSRLLNGAGNLFGAAVAVAVSYFAGKFVSDLLKDLLPELGFRKLSAAVGIKAEKPENTVAGLALIACIFAGALAGLELLGFTDVALLLRSFLPFAGNLLIAVLVVFAGIFAANFAAAHMPLSECQKKFVKAVIWFFAGTVALHCTGIGANIVQTAFTLILGAAAVAAAISFGIGGKEIAAQKLKEWTEKQK